MKRKTNYGNTRYFVNRRPTYSGGRYRNPNYGRRVSTSWRAPAARSTASAMVIAPRQRGYVRTGGYYGRFATGGEMKFFDSDVSDAPVGATLTINLLTIIPEGNGESERIGRKITLKRVSVLYEMKLSATTAASSTSETVRCMLIQDTQTNGAAFIAADLLDTDVMSSFNNLANSSRFKILFKQEFSFKAGGAAPSGAAYIFSEDQKYLRMTKKVNIPMEYDNSATTGVITSIRSNNLYWCTQATGATITSVGKVRVRYTDR